MPGGLSCLDELRTTPEDVICSQCTALPSRDCASSSLTWHLSTSNLLPGYSSSMLPVGLVSDSQLSSMTSDRCRAAELRAVVCPMTSSADRQMMEHVVTSLNDVERRVEHLRAGLHRAELELNLTMDQLTPRIAFHIQVNILVFHSLVEAHRWGNILAKIIVVKSCSELNCSFEGRVITQLLSFSIDCLYVTWFKIDMQTTYAVPKFTLLTHLTHHTPHSLSSRPFVQLLGSMTCSS